MAWRRLKTATVGSQFGSQISDLPTAQVLSRRHCGGGLSKGNRRAARHRVPVSGRRSGGQKNPRFGISLAAASMISAAVLSVSAASAGLACSVG